MASARAKRPRVACFATQGSGSGDHERIVNLLARVNAETLQFDRNSKLRSTLRLLAALIRTRPDLVVMEGTGVAGGLAVMLARALCGIPYVVSSGDAVEPYVRINHRTLAVVAGWYERLLCRSSAGYIGWSPYLVGRALTFGAPRAMTAANWSAPSRPERRDAIREELGIPPKAIVFGIVGSLAWSESAGYCYGQELVAAVRRIERRDIRVLVVGGGSGLERLRTLAGEDLGRRVALPGQIPKERVPEYLAAIDVASLPQSVDGVGSFRYTTKLSEYMASSLPVVTGTIPLAYDLDDGWIWRLPGDAPWDERYLEALADLMRTIDPGELDRRRVAVPTSPALFNRERQQRTVADFISDLLAQEGSARPL